jgi:hypothetical protein
MCSLGGSKSGSSSTTIPTLSPEQNAYIAAQTGLYTNTIGPAYQNAVCGATKMYNQSACGVNAAAQCLAGTAQQAKNTFGSTGCSALRTGICGLESSFSPQYEQQQLQAALMPGQAQYAQNIANQNAQFGGSGQLGSAREALAEQQTAGATEAAQEQTAAQVESNIATQRQNAANSLVSAGQSNLNNAISAAGQGVTASMVPQQLYNQYASILFGTPSQSYTPNFAGTQGSTTNTSASGVKI